MLDKNSVIHLIQSLNSGGCENFLLRLLPKLKQQKHLVVTLMDEGDLADKFRDSGVEVVEMGDLGGLVKIINREKPVLIITYLARADIVGRLWLPMITKTRVVPFLRTTYNYPRYWPMRLFERLTSGMVKKYLANSVAVKEYYVSKIGVEASKIEVIPNGLEVGRSKSVGLDRGQIGVATDEVLLVMVGNFHPNKGHRYLIEAFGGLNGGRLVLIGDGEVRKEMEKIAKKFGDRIIFLGRRNDVVDVLKLCDIFVLPTLFEGMSNAILEAMSAGLPIITTNIPENRELVSDGRSGMLVEPKDVNGLRLAIQRLIDDRKLRERMGRQAKGVISKKYNIEGIAGMVERYISDNIVYG